MLDKSSFQQKEWKILKSLTLKSTTNLDMAQENANAEVQEITKVIEQLINSTDMNSNKVRYMISVEIMSNIVFIKEKLIYLYFLKKLINWCQGINKVEVVSSNNSNFNLHQGLKWKYGNMGRNYLLWLVGIIRT